MSFSIREPRVSASSAAVMSSHHVILPIGIECEARSSADCIRRVSDIVRDLRDHQSSHGEGVEMVSFDEPVAPRLSRVEIARRGKMTNVVMTVSIRAVLPDVQDLWERLAFVGARYDLLAEFASRHENDKGVTISIEEAKFERDEDRSGVAQVRLK